MLWHTSASLTVDRGKCLGLTSSEARLSAQVAGADPIAITIANQSNTRAWLQQERASEAHGMAHRG